MKATIYALTCSGVVFYVGQTSNIADRIRNHILKSKSGKTEKDKKVKEAINKDGDLYYIVLATCEIEYALKLEHFFSNEFLNLGNPLLCKVIKNPSVRVVNSRLSSIETFVLKKISNGFTNSEIANTLDMSVRTIENVTQRVKRFFGCRTLGGLVYKAVKQGYLSI